MLICKFSLSLHLDMYKYNYFQNSLLLFRYSLAKALFLIPKFALADLTFLFIF